MRSRLSLTVLAFIIAPLCLAQSPNDPEFWRAPDDRVTDANGNLVSAVVKDRQHYVARIYRKGTWLEYRFAPHSERIVGTTGPDTTEEYRYGTHNEHIGTDIRFDGQLLSLHSDQQDHFRAGDMPDVALRRDENGRVVAISSGRTSIAEIHSIDGHPDMVRVGNGVSLSIEPEPQGGYKEVLSDAGRILAARKVTNTDVRRAPDAAPIDIVADDLGLSGHWRPAVAIRFNSTGSVAVVTDAQGKKLLYIAHYGAFSAGFDSSGKALYYDLPAEYYFGPIKNRDRLAGLPAVVPEHFTYTRDGRVGAYVRTPAADAIAAVWIGHDADGKVFVKFRYSSSNGNNSQSAHFQLAATRQRLSFGKVCSSCPPMTSALSTTRRQSSTTAE